MNLPENFPKAVTALRQAGYRVETNVSNRSLNDMLVCLPREAKLVAYSRPDRTKADLDGTLGLTWLGSGREIVDIMHSVEVWARWTGNPRGMIYIDLHR